MTRDEIKRKYASIIPKYTDQIPEGQILDFLERFDAKSDEENAEYIIALLAQHAAVVAVMLTLKGAHDMIRSEKEKKEFYDIFDTVLEGFSEKAPKVDIKKDLPQA